MATRIKMSQLERRILDRILLTGDGFEPVEDLLAALGADRNQFVDALETLEADGYLAVSSLGGSVVVAAMDPLAEICPPIGNPALIYTHRVGHC